MMRFIIACCLTALFIGAGCKSSSTGEPSAPPKSPPPAVDPDPRTAAVSESDALYERVEGTALANACGSDADCMKTGCSGEVCAAEEITTSCEVQDWPQGADADCGCVDGQCVWYQ